MSTLVGENDALHGAALSGVDEYGVPTDRAEGRPADGMPTENGDCGIVSFRGVRDDRGAGIANGDGGMVTRGDSGRCLLVPVLDALLPVTALCALDVEALES